MIPWLSTLLQRGAHYSPPLPCIDPHAHVLPGVDDGPATMECAVETLRHAAAAGVTHVVATSHANNCYETPWEAIATARNLLVAALYAAQVRIILLSGREIMFTEELLLQAATNTRLRIEGGKYALIELPEGLNKVAITEGLALLKRAGVRPILAHPERNWAVQNCPDCVKEWRLHGVLVQINAASITGAWGAAARRTARRLLEHESADMVGSDAHRPEDYDAYHRACAAIARQHGMERIKQLACIMPAYITHTHL